METNFRFRQAYCIINSPLLAFGLFIQTTL